MQIFQNRNWIECNNEIVMFFLSYGTKKKAKRLGVHYSFLFMKASGTHLSKITELINSGIIRPVVDKVFGFDAANDVLAYVESGRARKVVIKIN
ncbi:MAG: zinc-binding dehydrogenase [Flavobacterium sp.]